MNLREYVMMRKICRERRGSIVGNAAKPVPKLGTKAKKRQRDESAKRGRDK